MKNRRSSLLFLALFLALFTVACAGTKYRPVVTLDEPEEPTAEATPEVDPSIRPPMCVEIAMPVYPAEAFVASLPPVAVRVDFVVDEEGHARDVSAQALTESSFARDFEDAVRTSVSTWVCEPAWWIRRPPGKPWERASISVPVYLVFRFDREAVDRRAVFDAKQ